MKTQHCLILLFWLFMPVFLSAQVEAKDPSKIVVVLEDGLAFEGALVQWDTTSISINVEGEILKFYTDKILTQIPTAVISNSSEKGEESLIILKDKNWLKGQVLEVSKKSLLVENDEGKLEIPLSKLFKIYPAGQKKDHTESILHQDESYTYKPISNYSKYEINHVESKIYNITYGQFIYRFDVSDNPFSNDRRIDGLGVQHVVGYKFNNSFGLGVNLGFANYQVSESNFGFCDCFNPGPSLGRGENIHSVNVVSTGLSIRGELNQNKIRPYYNLDLGFNKPLRNKNINEAIERKEMNTNQFFFEVTPGTFNEKKSGSDIGILFQPSFGVQFKLKSYDFFIDLGYQYTNLNFENGDFRFDEESFYTVLGKEEVRNFVLRVGIKL